MASNLAAQLHPYLSYLLMGQLALFGGAILVGCVLVFRRLFSRKPAKDLGDDASRVAEEINEEIRRLRALRDRLSPDFAGEGDEPSVVAVSAPSGAANSSGADRDAIAKEVEAQWSGRVKELESQLALAAAAPASGADPAEVEKLKSEKTELEMKVAGLEKVISEYQIFEEDFALVKKYKEENERLRAAGAVPAEAPAPAGPKMTEQDIASLFGDIAGDAAKENPAPATPDPVPEPAPAPVEVAPSADANPPLEQSELEKLLAEAQSEADQNALLEDTPSAPAETTTIAAAPAASEAVPETLVEAPASTNAATKPAGVDPSLEAMAMEIDEGDAEAMSEAGGDDVMAEFEKLLGETGTKS